MLLKSTPFQAQSGWGRHRTFSLRGFLPRRLLGVMMGVEA